MFDSFNSLLCFNIYYFLPDSFHLFSKVILLYLINGHVSLLLEPKFLFSFRMNAFLAYFKTRRGSWKKHIVTIIQTK
ncbi:hypothetical protein AMJ44_01645 [candidate division WOR-1 bacterium DG_54_3]|uniref:Uncharacterized protein n=1 Tax=candidate division WOR-1 bacterium DG_54_3 TaxID=1703775 RepID=A0A0S7Y637_UNCSA|nr:MAG: hypothetical protein AMJ44_01645 [candidate division WOR-1 bacterium DG_54_3]